MAILIVAGKKNKIEVKLAELCREHGIRFSKNNPDILFLKPEKSIGIAEVRKIKGFLSLKSWNGKSKKAVIVMDAETMTIEAQSAFLKTLEEPPAGALIILTAGNKASLLPTVVSRCRLINLLDTKEIRDGDFKIDDWQKIIALPLVKKLTLIKSPNTETVSNWLRGYIFCLQEEMVGKNDPSLARFLKLLLEAEKKLKANLNPQSTVDWLMINL